MADTQAKRLESVPDDNQKDREEPQAPTDPADAARGEVVEDGPKTVNWHGLELSIPREMPAWFMFDMTDSEIEGDAQNSFAIRSVRNLVGPEQWKAARDYSVDKQLTMDDFVGLVNVVYESYGVGGPGEADGSDDSSENDSS